jgi:hypothetical protein
MKYVYLIEHRELDKSTQRFNITRTEVFTSLKKARASVDNSILCNKGYNVSMGYYFCRNKNESFEHKDMQDVTDYTTLGWGYDDARVEMRLRLIINKKELR